MPKLAIIHFSPLELYPPAMNWLNYLAGQDKGGISVTVYSSKAGADYKPFQIPTGRIKISRTASFAKKNSIARYWNYFLFYWTTSWKLIFSRPESVLYYETLSAFPATLYKRFFNRRARILIHYHEYSSPKDYSGGMRLNRWQHKLEKKIYPSAEWISHTNPERLEHFLADNKEIGIPHACVLPNYPPASWRKGKKNRAINKPVKSVYIGAMSLDTLYTQEFAEWVIQQKGCLTWDIYSANCTDEAKHFLQTVNPSWIRFHEGVDYFSLPEILGQYDVGVILYKGHIPNYIFNAPNKLFEYLACDLDVWFPENLKGSLPYLTRGSFPKVTALDFQQLQRADLDPLLDRTGLEYKASEFYCEKVLDSLLMKITG